MARFSASPLLGVNQPREPTAHNTAGGRAYQHDPKAALATQLMSNLGGDSYRDEGQQMRDLVNAAVAVNDWYWVAQAAVFARDVLGQRTVSHLLAAVVATHARGLPWLRRFYRQVVKRPDDMCEIIAAYMLLNGKGRVPNAMKRAFAQKFGDFDEYQLAKYRGGNRTVALVDVMRLCHPKGELIDRLARGTLRTPDTWETQLSAAQGPIQRHEVWHRLVSGRRLGYLAMLRNLRNIVKDAPDVLPEALGQLLDVQRMRQARVMPFQVLTALMLFDGQLGSISGPGIGRLDGLQGDDNGGIPNRERQQIVDCLSEVLDQTLDNIPVFEGPSLIAIDTSGSMTHPTHPKSQMRCVTAAIAFGAALAKKNPDSSLAVFADTAKIAHFGTRAQPVSTIIRSLSQRIGEVGHGTNFASVSKLVEAGDYRRVFFLSDMQGWWGDVDALNYLLNRRKLWTYLWNLQGDGTSQIDNRNRRLIQLSGYADRPSNADRVFDLIERNERPVEDVVTTISRLEI